MTMIKSVVMHDIPTRDIAAMERWYYKDHAPEICRRFGPWLTRHESFLPVDAPVEARKYGFYNWRLTEGYWREMPGSGPAGNLAFTVPPVWPKVATTFFPVQPTDDFMGGDVQPHEKNVLRWYILFRYPEGVSFEEGEDWFLNTHAPEVMKQPGLYRFFSTKGIKQKFPLPGVWPQHAHPPMSTLSVGWDRLIELWYDNFDDWKNSVIDNPPVYTKPSWATNGEYPFVELGKDFASTFLLERPNDEFWRDARGYL